MSAMPTHLLFRSEFQTILKTSVDDRERLSPFHARSGAPATAKCRCSRDINCWRFFELEQWIFVDLAAEESSSFRKAVIV